MQSVMNLLGDGRVAPEGVPAAIAIAVCVGEYTEDETRKWLLATIDDEEPRTIERWVRAMRDVDFFNSANLPKCLPSTAAWSQMMLGMLPPSFGAYSRGSYNLMRVISSIVLLSSTTA